MNHSRVDRGGASSVMLYCRRCRACCSINDARRPRSVARGHWLVDSKYWLETLSKLRLDLVTFIGEYIEVLPQSGEHPFSSRCKPPHRRSRLCNFQQGFAPAPHARSAKIIQRKVLVLTAGHSSCRFRTQPLCATVGSTFVVTDPRTPVRGPVGSVDCNSVKEKAGIVS